MYSLSLSTGLDSVLPLKTSEGASIHTTSLYYTPQNGMFNQPGALWFHDVFASFQICGLECKLVLYCS
jgi:hypothetical protein